MHTGSSAFTQAVAVRKKRFRFSGPGLKGGGGKGLNLNFFPSSINIQIIFKTYMATKLEGVRVKQRFQLQTDH